MKNNNSALNPLISVNYHLINACNYKCDFCFARFPQSNDSLNVEDAKKLIRLLADSGTEKITFVGGEPLLYKKLGDLLTYSKKLGLVVTIVSNGSLITKEFLDQYHQSIDWIGLSIDSANGSTERKIGRTLRNNKTTEFNHVDVIRNVSQLLKDFEISLKINTVVTSANYNENMNWLLSELQPKRWKVFQVLKIIGENDQTVDDLLISQNQFFKFIEDHQQNNPVFETNFDMTGSYIMIDPLGRFFDNTNGFLKFSKPILEVGIQKAFNGISFHQDLFLKRGGSYNWNISDLQDDNILINSGGL